MSWPALRLLLPRCLADQLTNHCPGSLNPEPEQTHKTRNCPVCGISVVNAASVYFWWSRSSSKSRIRGNVEWRRTRVSSWTPKVFLCCWLVMNSQACHRFWFVFPNWLVYECNGMFWSNMEHCSGLMIVREYGRIYHSEGGATAVSTCHRPSETQNYCWGQGAPNFCLQNITCPKFRWHKVRGFNLQCPDISCYCRLALFHGLKTRQESKKHLVWTFWTSCVFDNLILQLFS